jgi:hypothetical protein
MNTTPNKAEMLILIVIILSLCLTLHFMGGHKHEIQTRIVDMSREAQFFEPEEFGVIFNAAARNGIEPGTGNWFILLAIRKAEAGREGLEFGIMNSKAYDLDSQAGWAAASIVKGRQRWIDAGKPDDFITHFGSRYCPPEDDPLNKNWAPNVRHWVKKLRGTK